MFELKKVCKKCRKSKYYVLKDVTYSFPEKGLFIISGANDIEKEALVKLLTLIDKPTTGEVLYLGRRVSKILINSSKLRNKFFSFVFHENNLISNLTIKDNILLPLLINNEQVDEENIYILLKRIKLDVDLNQYPTNLTLNDQRKLAIVRAILNNSECVIIEDESMFLSDEDSNIIYLLKELSESRLIIIISSNALECFDVSYNKLIIEDGNLKIIKRISENDNNHLKTIIKRERKPSLLMFKLGVRWLRTKIYKTVLPTIVFSAFVSAVFSLVGINNVQITKDFTENKIVNVMYMNEALEAKEELTIIKNDLNFHKYALETMIIILFIIAIPLFVSYIYNFVNSKRDDMCLLRTMGMNIYKFLIIFGFISIFLSIVISFVAYFSSNMLLNILTNFEGYSYQVSYKTTTFDDFLISLLMSFISIIIFEISCVYNYYHKKSE